MAAVKILDSDETLFVYGFPAGLDTSAEFVVPSFSTINDPAPTVADTTSFPLYPPVTFSFGAQVVTDFFNDWYYRIHMLPGSLPLGNVINDQVKEVLIWNAFLSDKVLNSTSFPVDQGINVVEPVSTPYTFRPLEYQTYLVNVNAEGPATIDVTLRWTISGEDYDVGVTGRRIIVFPFGPNWSRPMVESLEWKTDVLTAYSGDEQRIQLRSKPRRGFEYTAHLFKADAATFRNILWGWQNRNFALPLWNDRSKLTSAAGAGATALSLDTSNRGFFAGGLLVLLNGPLDYEAVEISTVLSTSVTLARPLERAWTAGTKVYPVNISRMPVNVAARRLTDGVEEAVLSFEADPLQTDPIVPTASASTTFNGYEVVLKKPNWAQPVTLDNQYDFETVDYGTGSLTTIPTREFPQVTRRFQWMFKDRAAVTEFRGLLGRLKGRFKSAYLPTWFDDFELYQDITASSVTIPVKNNEFLKMVGVDPALKTLMILVKGQAPIIRSINSVGEDASGFITLGLNAAVGQDLNSSTLLRLSLVHLCRMTSDRVTINWLSDSVATVEANFTLVKA